MKTKRKISALFIGAALASTLVCGPALALSQPPTSSQDSGAKKDMKEAGHETKEAAKDAGNSVKKGTKKVYHKTKSGTKKVLHKTEDTTKGAVNGAKEGAKKPE